MPRDEPLFIESLEERGITISSNNKKKSTWQRKNLAEKNHGRAIAGREKTGTDSRIQYFTSPCQALISEAIKQSARDETSRR